MTDRSAKNKEKLRFALVGVANTTIDFGVLFTLTFFGLNKIPANYVSTTAALIFSFFANKSFTFKSSGNTKKQIVPYFIVTLIGIWVLQPIIIWGLTSGALDFITHDTYRLFVAKVIATLASLVWNYTLYSRIVFK